MQPACVHKVQRTFGKERKFNGTKKCEHRLPPEIQATYNIWGDKHCGTVALWHCGTVAYMTERLEVCPDQPALKNRFF